MFLKRKAPPWPPLKRAWSSATAPTKAISCISAWPAPPRWWVVSGLTKAGNRNREPRASFYRRATIQAGMSKDSTASVLGATVADFSIAAAALFAAVLGGSSAMYSECVHSAVDGVNDLLLLLGINRSQRPANEHHPFGYGKEFFFGSLIVSCSVFVIGGAVSFIEGISHVRKPEALTHTGWAYAALGCGALFTSGSFLFSVRKFRKENQQKDFWEAVRETKDPPSLMVVFVDGAAFLGELIAAAGVFFNTRGFLLADGIASLLIGCLLAAVGAFLIMQNRDLVVGEGVEDHISRAIHELATGEDKFLKVRAAHSMHFGPETVLVTIESEFDPERKAGELIEAVDKIQKPLRERSPAVKFIYVDPETGAGGRKSAESPPADKSRAA